MSLLPSLPAQTPAPCMRCGTLEVLTPHEMLRLCTQCSRVGLASPCDPFMHMFRGTIQPGFFVCLMCGMVLDPTVIVKTPQPLLSDPGDFL